MKYEGTYLLTGGLEGTCMMTSVLGTKPEFIMTYDGHHFDRDWNVIKTAEWKFDDPRWESMGIQLPTVSDVILSLVGLQIVGFPPRSVVTTTRIWSEWTHLSPDGQTVQEQRRIKARREETRYFYIKQFPYALRYKGLETNMGFKVDIDFTIYVEGTNPHTALVKNDDWYMQLEALVRSRIRNYIGCKNFFELLSENSKAAKLMQKNNALWKYLEKRRVEEEAGNQKKENVPVENDEDLSLPPFYEYMIQTTIPGQKSGEKISLSEGLGVTICNAVIEDMSLSEDEKELTRELSKIPIQDIKNLNIVSEAKARKDAENQATEALAARFLQVDSKYLATPGGVAIATARANAVALEKVAQSIGENKTLKSVVLPSIPGSNQAHSNSLVQPVFTVNNEENPSPPQKESK